MFSMAKRAFIGYGYADAEGEILTADNSIYARRVKIYGETDGEWSLVSCGRNIWDGSLIEGHVRPTDGEELSWAGFYKTDFIPVPPDTDYVITYTKPSSGTTFWAIYYDINKNYISSQNLAPFTPPFSIKTPIGTTYLRITGATLSMTTLTQIELGSTATPYTPFRGMTTIPFDVSLSEGDCVEVDNETKTTTAYIGGVPTPLPYEPLKTYHPFTQIYTTAQLTLEGKFRTKRGI